MISDYFNLSFNNLRRRGLRSWLTLLGIFIGIAAVVSLITLGNGLRTAVTSQFGISSTEVITVQAGGLNAFGPPGSGAVNKLTIQDVEEIERLGSVKRAIRRNLPFGKLEYNDIVIFGISASVPDGDDREFVYEVLDVEPEKGRLLRDGDDNKVVLGFNFYDNKVGLDKSVDTGDKVKIQDKEFEVIGITKQKGSFIFDNIVYMNDNPLEALMGYGDEVDAIAVQAKSSNDVERAKEDITKLLRKRRDVKEGEENFEVSTPQQALETVDQVLAGVQIFIVMIALVAIIVGAIGIVNTMTTSVLERRREIGIMKAIGAKNSDIFLQFFIEAGLLGLIGGIVGIIVGISIGYVGILGINSFLGVKTSPDISILLIIFSLLGSFLVGSISGIAPAMRAARQRPVDALRS